MTADRRGVTAEAGRELYDQATELLSAIMAGSPHYGHSDGPADTGSTAEASRRMTGLMIDKLTVGRGGRVLDVGCGTGRRPSGLPGPRARKSSASPSDVNRSSRRTWNEAEILTGR